MADIKINKNSALIFRVMLSLIFIIAGYNHLLETEKVTLRLVNAKMSYLVTYFAPPDILVILAGIGLIIGGIMLLMGLKTRLAAGLLILLIIPITITIQFTNPEGLGPLFKNVGLTGGLIFFFKNGSLFYGIDQIFKKNKLKHETN